MSYQNLADMFFRRAADFAGKPRYRVKRDGRWVEVTWDEHARAVEEIAAGLIAAGVAPGTKVALLSGTRPEWMEIDFGILAAGAVTIPIYPSNLPDECGYILWNSESSYCFVENSAQLKKVHKVAEEGFELDGRPQKLELRQIFMIDGEPADGRTRTLRALREDGRRALPGARREIDARVAKVAPGDLATIVYTSGTTGPPKGVVQTHGNHLATVEAMASLDISAAGDVDFFFLPLAHSFARASEYVGTRMGTITAFAQSIESIPSDIRETRPHFVPSVPRIFEKVYSRILSTRESAGWLQRMVFDWAVAVGREKSARLQQKLEPSLWLSLKSRIADTLVFSKIKDTLGGRIKYMISGGAPLAREIQEFFHAAGILVLEGYGLTETTPTLTVNRPDDFRFGTVGKPVPGVTLKIAEDGEILAKGPNIAQGYFKRPEATAEAWDREGWFHTGDIGEFDADGFLKITDRKKDLLKTSGGKYVAPQNVENLLKTRPYISQAVLIGDNRKYCVALVTLDPDQIRRWAKSQGIEETDPAALAKHPKVIELIDAQVEAANQHLASYESVKYHRIVPHDFSQETGELTPSLKVKRKFVNQKYAEVIEEMYR
ncbi:MAG TPA: long-chain fatty acid--CoA ligase [Candidatus Binatia bacterium]|nr:long-chain fatty acid--CoA ligase [Candidatus Binatia bacterium]